MLYELNQEEVVRTAADIHEKQFGTEASAAQVNAAFFLMRSCCANALRKEDVLAAIERRKAAGNFGEIAKACSAVISALERLLAETN